MLGECADAVLSRGSSFGQTGWARTLKHLPIEVDNFDMSCERGFADDPIHVIHPECCASYPPPCPPQCVLQ